MFDFIRVSAGAFCVKPADPMANLEAIRPLVARAEALQSHLIVFPDLALSGATCGDLFLQSALHKKIESAIRGLLEMSKTVKTAIAVGAPVRADGCFYKAMLLFHNGACTPFFLTPNAEECRYFAKPDTPEKPFAIGNAVFSFDETVPAHIYVMPRACPIVFGYDDAVYDRARYRAKSQGCGVLYVNATGDESCSDGVYGGGLFALEKADTLARVPPFSDDPFICVEFDPERIEQAGFALKRPPIPTPEIELDAFETDDVLRGFSRTPFVPESPAERVRWMHELLEIQSRALAQRIRHTRGTGTLLGLSGGLDSTWALRVCHHAAELNGMPASSVRTFSLPGFGTTHRTQSNAEKLAKALGTTHRIIPIGPMVEQHFADIGHAPENRNVVFENAQARARTLVLMDIANGENALLVGTGDMSECALGWCTYNGDHMSMYGLNGSLTKSMLRAMVEVWIAEAEPAVAEPLRDILNTPVSPELLPHDNGKIVQETESILGSYTLHDFYLYHLIFEGLSPEKVKYMAKTAFAETETEAEIDRTFALFVHRFTAQQFKRSCAPDGVKAIALSLGRFDFRMPGDAGAALFR